MSNNANSNSTRVVTGKVRLSYVHVFTPYAKQQGQEPKYSVTLLIPKSDLATKQRIDAAIQAAIQAGVSSKWNGARPPVLSVPIHDGDGVRPSDGMPFGEECKGHWVMTASSKQAPQIVDASLNPIIDQTQVYSGIYARVSINFFPYNNNGKKGIGCGLGNVQKLEDGEPLGNRTTAADDFGNDSFGLDTPTYPQQPTYTPPVQNTYTPPTPQPAYAPYIQPIQPAYPQQPVQIDPITGKPIAGGVMGIDSKIPF